MIVYLHGYCSTIAANESEVDEYVVQQSFTGIIAAGIAKGLWLNGVRYNDTALWFSKLDPEQFEEAIYHTDLIKEIQSEEEWTAR